MKFRISTFWKPDFNYAGERKEHIFQLFKKHKKFI